MNKNILCVNGWARLGAITVGMVTGLAVCGYSQGIDTAKVPIVVNVAATVTITPPEGGTGIGSARSIVAAKTDRPSSTPSKPGSGRVPTVQGSSGGNRPDSLILILNKAPEVTSISHRQQRADAPVAVSRNRSGVSLKLQTGSYDNANISLFSVDGRRVLHGKADAVNGTFGLSRANIAAGIYLLSVKGSNNNTFAARLSHNGGRLNINASFDCAGTSPAPLRQTAKAAADDEWTITATSPGYYDTSYTFAPVKGRNTNPIQNITLRRRPAGGDLGIGPVGCSREGLINATSYLIAAIRAGDHTIMPLTGDAKYYENDNNTSMYGGSNSGRRPVDFGKGLWEKAFDPTYYMNFADVDSCLTFSELIFEGDTPQYINGVRLRVSGDKISEVTTIVTQQGDWFFYPENYVTYSAAEDWTEIPPSRRLSRQELLTGSEAYFKYFGDRSVDVPWGNPCSRLEGGAYTGSSGTCSVGVPEPGQSGGQNMPTIWHVIDVNYGMCVLYVNFGGPDTHMFRHLKDHGMRYIHTLTAMKESSY